MASGHVNRTNRPNTWLHRPATRREDSPCQLGAVRVGSLRRTDSVAIEGIADIGEALLPVGATRMNPLQTSAALTNGNRLQDRSVAA
jgi:hypothetical protein